MFIQFKWEQLCENTFRAPVIGGWIISHGGYSTDTGDEISTSLVFVPDPNHSWEID